MVWWWRQRSDLETDVWLLLLLLFFSYRTFSGSLIPTWSSINRKQKTVNGCWCTGQRWVLGSGVTVVDTCSCHTLNKCVQRRGRDGWMDGWVNKGLLLRPLCLSVTPGHKEHPGPVMETFHCSSDFSLQRRRGQKHQGWCRWHLTDLLTIVTKLLQLPHWLLVLTITHQYVRSTSRTWPSV